MEALASGIWEILPEGRPIYPYSNSVWIDDDISLLIDAGSGSRVYGQLPRPVDTLLFTHAHFDHLHCSDMFKNAALWVADEEKTVYQDEATYLSFHGYDHWAQMMHGIVRPPYGEVRPVGDDVPVKPGYRYFAIAGCLSEGVSFNTGHYTVRALHLPGHTHGHYGFYIEEADILVSGDLDFSRIGPAYYNASGDVAASLASVERVKALNPGRAVPSHRGVQQGNMAAKLDAYAEPVLQRIDWLYSYLAQPRREDDLYEQRLLFTHPANIYEDFWNRMTMLHHLEHMAATGRMREVEPGVLERI